MKKEPAPPPPPKTIHPMPSKEETKNIINLCHDHIKKYNVAKYNKSLYDNPVGQKISEQIDDFIVSVSIEVKPAKKS